MTDKDRFDEVIRQAMAREADSLEPRTDGLHEIRRKIRESRPAPRRPWLLTTGAAVLGTAAAIGLFAVLDKDQTPQAGNGESVAGRPSTTTPTPTPTRPRATQPTVAPGSPVTPGPTRSDTPRPEVTRAVPVYWMGDVVGRPDLGPRLYRTFVRVHGDPAVEAVEQLSTGKPDDPDYSSAWSGAQVSSVDVTGRTITVDFSQLPRKQLGSEAASVAAQALVHTVQGTLENTDPVRVTLNGGPAGQLFGHVDTGTPIRRAPAIDVQAAIWITSPTNNASVTSPVKITGIASVFEATVNWQVRDTSKRVVQEGYTTASAGGPSFGDFSFTVKLPPGDYLLECFESSPEDGRATFTDTKTITVR
jgi:Immunoglobulin-like domain of bacterial spore germination/Sporulation and spore germination